MFLHQAKSSNKVNILEKNVLFCLNLDFLEIQNEEEKTEHLWRTCALSLQLQPNYFFVKEGKQIT